MNEEMKVINEVASRLDLVYKYTSEDNEVRLTSVPMDEGTKESLKQIIKDGHFRERPWYYYICVFEFEEGDKLFPLPMLLELKESEMTPWLRKIKINLLKEIMG